MGPVYRYPICMQDTSATTISWICKQPVFLQDVIFFAKSMYDCVSVIVKSSLNQRQIKTSFETGRIMLWRWNQMRVGDVVYPPWSVDVGGLCSRNIQINLFKTFWYLTLGTHKQMLARAPTCLGMCNSVLLCFIYRFKCLYFPLFQLLFSGFVCTQEENVNSALITVQIR